MKISRINNLLIFFLIALSGSVFHVGFFSATYLLGLLFTTYVLLSKKSYDVKQLYIFVASLFFFCSLFCLNFILSLSADFKDYGVVIMQVFLSLLILLVLKIRGADIKFHLYFVLRFLIILSFIGFFLSIFKIGSLVVLGTEYNVYTIFFLFYYASELQVGFLELFRNQGIFWEPGLLAIYANIFLLLSLFVYKNKQNSILAILCILTTASTTGLFIMLVQVLFFFRTRKFSLIQKTFLFLCAGLFSVLVLLSFTEKKVESEQKAVSSYGLRYFDLYSGTMVAVSNPVFGIGLNTNVFLKERDKFLTPEMIEIFSLIEYRNNSNSLLALFYSLGLIFGTLWLFLLYKQDLIKDQRKLFFFIAIVSFFSEPLVFTPFFYCFVFSGFQSLINFKYE